MLDQDIDKREEGRRAIKDRRRTVRRGMTQRAKVRRHEALPVDDEKRVFSIRRMCKRRAMSRRSVDRRSGLNRRV